LSPISSGLRPWGFLILEFLKIPRTIQPSGSTHLPSGK
jgi:hypothetical protein